MKKQNEEKKTIDQFSGKKLLKSQLRFIRGGDGGDGTSNHPPPP